MLPLFFSSCSTSFSMVFHQFFKSILSLLALTFVSFSSRFFRNNFKRRSLFKMHFWPATLLWMFLLQHTYGSSFSIINFSRNGRPGWAIYNEKHTYICRSGAPPQKTGSEMSIQDMANRWTPKINYGQKWWKKTGEFAPTPWFHRKKQLWEISGPSKIMEKKVQITSWNFEPLRENPYGKNGDRRAV